MVLCFLGNGGRFRYENETYKTYLLTRWKALLKNHQLTRPIIWSVSTSVAHWGWGTDFR